MEGLMQPGVSSEPRSYTDFEPRSQWMQAEEGDTLIVDVSGFRKEQMKVLIDTSGILKISGERPLDDKQWLRFLKYYTVPKNCNPKGIQAKLDKEEGLLYVVLPKKAPQQAHSRGQHEQAQEPTYNASIIQQNVEDKRDSSAAASQEIVRESSAQQKIGQRMSNLVMALRQNKLKVGNIVMAIIVTLGILTYLGYRHRSSI